MPPRHAYWTIIVGNQPTAFRSSTADELLPTLRQLQSKHPDAVMMWFARGRLWPSPDAARAALARDRRPAWRNRPQDDRARAPRPEWRDRPQGGRPRGAGPEWRDRPPGDRPRGPKPEWRDRRPGEARKSAAPKPGERAGERRGRDWRPGGEHRDPRDRFKVPRDVKRARFAARQRRKKKDEE